MGAMRIPLFATASAAALLMATSALGQTAERPAPGGANSTLDEVVVTGSRAIVDGNQAPNPTTVMSLEQLRASAPSNLSDALAQVPQFRASTRPGSFISPQASTGAFLNLRGLGANRGLVLFDGRRTVPTTLNGTIDINVFPESLVKRIDVVTGGASAAYGSDAVAGVVNFVLDSRFEGFKAEISGGVSDRNDGKSQKVTVAGGARLLNDRLHVVGSLEYYESDGVLNTNKRDWDRAHYDIIPNPTPTDGRPANLFRSNVTASAISFGGLITDTALRGTQFLPGGVRAPFTFGTDVSASTMVGGSGVWVTRGNVLTPLRTESAFLHGSYDVSDSLTLFAEGAYADSKSTYPGSFPTYNGTAAFTIFNDNAFLPTALRTEMASRGITQFRLGRVSRDWGGNIGTSDTETYRGAIGFNAKVADWTVDGSYDFGKSTADIGNLHSPIQQNTYNAIDTVISPTTGQAVCRSTVTNPGNGCVPLNPFGEGAASQAAIAYIMGDGYSQAKLRQDALALSARGSPLSSWAGPINVGLGVEYRKISASQTADPISQSVISQAPGSKGLPANLVGVLGGFFTGNQRIQPKQSYNVKEAFVEVLVPLMKDQPLAKDLDLNAAIRYADYSSSGGVASWKVGLTYAPIDQVRFRGTRSRDVRAANINELYAPLNGPVAAIRDPVKGTNQNTPALASGNPDLDPELADTLTLGVVYRPDWLPGFSASIDYYDIKIKGAIGNLSAQNTVNLCASGVTDYCQFVTRLPDQTLVSVAVPTLNLNKVREKGVDFEASYNTDIDRWISGWQGSLSIRAIVSYIDTLATTDPFGQTLDAAGVNGGEGSTTVASGIPTWQGSLTVTYLRGPLAISVQQRGLSSGKYSNIYVEGGAGTNGIDVNHVGGREYTDLTVKYAFETGGGRYEVFGTVNNLFDRDPPYSPSRVGPPTNILGTNPTLYDVMGRFYTVGLRLRY